MFLEKLATTIKNIDIKACTNIHGPTSLSCNMSLMQ